MTSLIEDTDNASHVSQFPPFAQAVQAGLCCVDKQIRAERKERHFTEASFLLVTIRPPLHHLRPLPPLRKVEAVRTKAERNMTWSHRAVFLETIAATETRIRIQRNDNMHQAHPSIATYHTPWLSLASSLEMKDRHAPSAWRCLRQHRRGAHKSIQEKAWGGQ
jgi:hypothetical protein